MLHDSEGQHHLSLAMVIALLRDPFGLPVISLFLPVIFGRFPVLALIFLQILHRSPAPAPLLQGFTGKSDCKK